MPARTLGRPHLAQPLVGAASPFRVAIEPSLVAVRDWRGSRGDTPRKLVGLGLVMSRAASASHSAPRELWPRRILLLPGSIVLATTAGGPLAAYALLAVEAEARCAVGGCAGWW